MSGSTRSILGSVMQIVGYALIATGVGAGVGYSLIAAGTLLSYDGMRRLQREAERRARAGFRASSVKGNVRGSYEHHQIAFGEVRVGGIIVVVGTSDGPDAANQYLYLGIAHSIVHAGGCEGITGLYVDDTLVPTGSMSGDPNAGEVDVNTGTFNGLVHLRHYRGTGTQAADATLASLAVDASTSYRRGIAWTWVRLKKTTDDTAFRAAFKFGIPTIAAKIKGWRVYDPRLDSTNGGSGSHRVADPTTWAWSDNPILCAATYSIVGTGDGGMGIPQARIDWPSVAAAASICDESISTPGGSISRFRCNGVVSTADKREVNLQKILDSCMGKRVRAGNKYKFYAACDRTASAAIDQTWLAGAVQITTRNPLEALYNAVRGNFDDASQDFKTIEFPPYTSATYETQDGGQRVFADLNLPMVTSAYGAQYLAQIHHKRSRKQLQAQVLCNLKALDVEVWETCTLSLPDIGVDLSAYKFRIVGWDFAEQGISLTLQEDAASVYTVDTMTVPSVGTSPSVGVETPPQISGVTATPMPSGILLKFNPPPAYSTGRTIIERSSTGGGSGFSVIGYAGMNESSYLDPDSSGGTWFYRLRGEAWKGGVYGAYSAEVSATAMAAGDKYGSFVINSGFESGDQDWTKDTGWTIVRDATNKRTGSWCAKLPGTGATQNVAITDTRRVPIAPGEVCQVTGFLKSTASANGTGKVAARYFDSSGNYLSDDTGNNISAGTTYNISRRVSTAPASAAYVSHAFIVNAFSVGSSEAWFADDAVLITSPKEAYNLTVAGSGQRLGDQRNVPVILGLNNAPALVSGSNPLTAADVGTTATITIAAHTIQIGSGTISYNSGSITGLAFNTTYYIYADDPGYAGGAVTYVATTSGTVVTAGNDRYYVGKVKTPVDGGGGTGGDSDPCVAIESWLTPELRAGMAQPGDLLYCHDEFGDFFEFPVHKNVPDRAPCRHIRLEGGAELIVSHPTPITLRGGRLTKVCALQLGDELCARYGDEDRWERIERLGEVGEREVAHINACNLSYAAGMTPGAMIYTHNAINK